VPHYEIKLVAAMFGQMKFKLPNENAAIVVMANAVLFDTEGAQVATIADGNRIHWKKIKVGRDFGTQLEVLEGLTERTKMVMNPTDDLREGVQVEVKPFEKPKSEGDGTQSAGQ